VTVDVSGDLIHDPEAELRVQHGTPAIRPLDPSSVCGGAGAAAGDAASDQIRR
jgi:hypothetical protein